MEEKIIILVPGVPHCVFIASEIKEVNRNKVHINDAEFVETEAAVAGCVPSSTSITVCIAKHGVLQTYSTIEKRQTKAASSHTSFSFISLLIWVKNL